jgi:hypothetical protein
MRDEPIANWEEIAFDLADYAVPVEPLDCGHSPRVLATLRAWEDACDSRPVRRVA